MECCLGIKDYTIHNQEKKFMPFELDEFEKNMTLLDIDPDLIFLLISIAIYSSHRNITQKTRLMNQ